MANNQNKPIDPLERAKVSAPATTASTGTMALAGAVVPPVTATQSKPPPLPTAPPPTPPAAQVTPKVDAPAPTIAELDKILAGKDKYEIEKLPTGEVRAKEKPPVAVCPHCGNAVDAPVAAKTPSAEVPSPKLRKYRVRADKEIYVDGKAIMMRKGKDISDAMRPGIIAACREGEVDLEELPG